MRRMVGACCVRGWLLTLALAAAGHAQTAAPSGSQTVRPIGAVTSMDVAAHRITLKTDAGPELAVLLQDATTFLRVPPGEKDLKNSTRIALADVGVGDRILVRGKLSDDHKSIQATAVIVMTKADIAKKHEADRAEWQRRGVSGTITALNVAAKQITISTRTPEGRKPLTLALAVNAELRRYAPDSVRFSDAKISAIDALKVGDEVRALGNKSEDGSRYTAEELVSGSFRNIAGIVMTASATENTIKITDLESKKPLVVRVNADSSLRRLPPMIAQMMALRLRGGGMGSGGQVSPAGTGPERGGPGGGVVPARGPARPDRMPAGGGPGDGPPGGMRRPGGGAQDISQLLERMPVLTLADLKSGDAIIVASTVGADPGQVTAITLLAGVEPLLTAAPGGGQQVNFGTWNFEMNMNMP